MEFTVDFPSGTTIYHFGNIDVLEQLSNDRHIILLTDSNVANALPAVFTQYPTIVLSAGEDSKTMATITHILSELVRLGATRNSVLIGIGGGVITDIAGFAAASYMRGIACGFIPTSLLAMVDAAIGGKNGVNIGLYKNIAGTIRQPEFLLFDTTLLQTLPDAEWSNGFAEVIKYACIFDAPLFDELEANDLAYYYKDTEALTRLVTRCVAWKNKVVLADEHEKGERKLLNFGHTAAHAIENLHSLPHGQAVAIGMVIASRLSQQETGLQMAFTDRLKQVLERYGLRVTYPYEADKALEILKMDKKRAGNKIDYILLEAPGKAIIRPLNLDIISKIFTECAQ